MRSRPQVTTGLPWMAYEANRAVQRDPKNPAHQTRALASSLDSSVLLMISFISTVLFICILAIVVKKILTVINDIVAFMSFSKNALDPTIRKPCLSITHLGLAFRRSSLGCMYACVLGCCFIWTARGRIYFQTAS